MAYASSVISYDLHHLRLKNDDREKTQQYIEDITILWFDQYMDEIQNQQDVEKTKTLLHEINDYVLFFSKPEPCFDYINSAEQEKIFLIMTGSYAKKYLDKIHELQQIDAVFIFCLSYATYLELKEKYWKIIGIFTEQKDLMDSLRDNIESVTKQAAAFGLFDGQQRSTKFLKKESASFLWFQLLTDVLRNITISDVKNTGIEEMLTHCQSYYRGNKVELKNIDEFRKTYKPEDAIVWYSKESFVYRLVNKALRTEDLDALYTFRVYITHLRTQIALEHGKLRRANQNGKSNVIRLYRGLKMNDTEINQMVDNVGGIVSMNGFFSTSRDIDQAMRFATKPSQRKNVIGVILEIEGDVNLERMIFADIEQYSVFHKEKEVLFDLATVFKIVHVEFEETKKLWRIQLTGVEKSCYIVNEYIKSVEKENEESNSTLLLSRLMCDMGEYSKSEKYLRRLLSNLSSDHPNVSKIYFHLGRVCYLRSEYRLSLDYYEQALDKQKRDIAPKEDSFDIAITLHNIANIHLKLNQITKAVDYYEKALEMKRRVLVDNPNHASIATTLAALGWVYRKRGDLSKALDLYQQSYELKKRSLAVDHPSIADSLNGLGTVYQEMDNYEQALDCYGKALEIKQKSLPPTHPSISDTLNNMGTVYRRKGNYNEALISFTQTLEIEQTRLAPDNLDLADTYGNLCSVYYDMSDYGKALEMARYKLNILRKNLDDNDEQIQLAKDIIDEILKDINQPTTIKKDSPYAFEEYF